VDQISVDDAVRDWASFSTLLSSFLFFFFFNQRKKKKEEEKRRVDGEVNPGGHVLGGRSPHTKKRKTSAQNTAQDRDFTIRYRPSPGLPQNIRIRGASGRSWTVSISSIPRALTYSTKKGRKRIVLWLMTVGIEEITFGRPDHGGTARQIEERHNLASSTS